MENCIIFGSVGFLEDSFRCSKSIHVFLNWCLACVQPIKASDQPAHQCSLMRIFFSALWVAKVPVILHTDSKNIGQAA